jgi:FtsP/CotA-like multicopper oxidase with cupredoxin domain
VELSRRHFLGTGALVAASGVVGTGLVQANPVPTLLVGNAGEVGEPLRDIPEIRSNNGVLDYSLTIAARSLRIGGRTLNLDTYNEMLPGPLLRFGPGEKLRLRLSNLMRPMGIPLNQLPPMCATRPPGHVVTPQERSDTHGGVDDCVPEMVRHVGAGETVLQMLTTTNLHTHGLQVSPEDPADNIYLKIPPLGSHQFEYRIPLNQPGGLYWYHPHHHGATSHQGWSGLAGPMIVEGEIDQVPEIAEMREHTLVINSLWFDQAGEVPSALVVPTGGPMPFSSVPAVPTEMMFTVNGQLQPVIEMRPGETQRWRVLNAAPHRAMWLHIDGHSLHQIGQDGIPFGYTRPMNSVMLSSANRAEFVVRAGEPGAYRIYARSYDQGHPGTDRPSIELATLVVRGPRTAGRIPQRLVEPPRMPNLPVARHRTIRFKTDISGRYGLGVRAYIDGRIFAADRIDQDVEPGTIEDWTFVNDDVMQHPIHIHVNPFQVINVQGIPPGDTSWQTDPTIWWDTFRIPPHGQYTLRTYFRPDITGKTVFHCHILPHEDQGMMANLLIGS